MENNSSSMQDEDRKKSHTGKFYTSVFSDYKE